MSFEYIDNSDDSFDIHCPLTHGVTWSEINIAPLVLQVNKVDNLIILVT